MSLQLARIPSPLSDLLIVTDAQGQLCALDFADYEARMRALLARNHPGQSLSHGSLPETLRARLDAYFAGELHALGDVKTAAGGTPFRKRVWRALREIPAGTTTTYGALAGSLGKPRASRAVGLANGKNPIAIVVPCHRVIGQGGSLTGYAGGLARKRWLLEHERKNA